MTRDRRPPEPPRPPRRLRVDTCAACDQVLAEADGCPAHPYPTAYRWGDEAYFAEEDLEPAPRCPDCWAPIGRHHHDDCIRAECSICDDRIYACPHNTTGATG